MNKRPLPLDQYQTYEINQAYEAFILSFFGLSEKECDDIEAEFVAKGYKIFHVDVQVEPEGKFCMSMICAQMNFTF